jgi:hypothetical protein
LTVLVLDQIKTIFYIQKDPSLRNMRGRQLHHTGVAPHQLAPERLHDLDGHCYTPRSVQGHVKTQWLIMALQLSRGAMNLRRAAAGILNTLPTWAL